MTLLTRPNRIEGVDFRYPTTGIALVVSTLIVASQFRIVTVANYEVTLAWILVGSLALFVAAPIRITGIRMLAAVAALTSPSLLIVTRGPPGHAVDAGGTLILLISGVGFLTLLGHGRFRDPQRASRILAAAAWIALTAIAGLAIMQGILDRGFGYDRLYNPWGTAQWFGGYDYAIQRATRSTAFFLEPSHVGLSSNALLFVLILLRGRWVPAAIVVAGAAQYFALSGLGLAGFLTVVAFYAWRTPAEVRLVSASLLGAAAMLAWSTVGYRFGDFGRRGTSGDYRFVQPAEALIVDWPRHPFGNGLGSGERIAQTYQFIQLRVNDTFVTTGLDNTLYSLAFALGVLAIPFIILVLAISGGRREEGRSIVLCLAAIGFCFYMLISTGAAFNPEMIWMVGVVMMASRLAEVKA